MDITPLEDSTPAIRGSTTSESSLVDAQTRQRSTDLADDLPVGQIWLDGGETPVEHEIDEGGNSDLEIVLLDDDDDDEDDDNNNRQQTPFAERQREAASYPNDDRGEKTPKASTQANKDPTAAIEEAAATIPPDETNATPATNPSVKTKKKTKKKPKSKRGRNAPSGFEEYYVDPPVTPAEHQVEKGLYHESIPFTQRIETAIQRYCSRRRLESNRKNVFDKYLAYGGVNCGQKMFSGGLDQATLADHNAQEIASMTATHFVPVDREDPDVYVVDFERCTKAFFSSRMPLLFDLFTAELIVTKVGTIRNFFNYLLHHDVAPEYRKQIYDARSTCDLAENQLCKIRHLNVLLPGKFQTACSEIFNGSLRGYGVSAAQDWNRSCLQEGTDEIGLTPEKAKQTFKVGLAAQATDEVLAKYEGQGKSNTITTTRVVEKVGLEITAIIRPDADIKRLYTHPSASGLHPLGKVLAKAWHPPDIPNYDTPLDLPTEVPSTFSATEDRKFEFFIEDHILSQIFLGMKCIVTVRELSFGITYFDEISGIYCSFYDVLPNSLMDNWVEPGPELPYRDMHMDLGANGAEASGTAEDDGEEVKEEP